MLWLGIQSFSTVSRSYCPSSCAYLMGAIVTLGNHTAIQSTFAGPCIPAHESNITINGFDSGFRDAGNGTAITILSVPILPQNVNTTMWFYDYNTCGEGGVGVINANDSSTQTLEGFEVCDELWRLESVTHLRACCTSRPQRNAVRLNGTGSLTSSSAASSATSPSGTSGSASSSSTTTAKTSAAHHLVVGGLSVLPLIAAALTL